MTVRYPPPDTRDMGRCKRCKLAIRFVHLVSGKRVPVDPDPTPSGRLAVRYEPESGVYVGGAFIPMAETSVAEGTVRFDPHTDSCGRRSHPRNSTPPPDLVARMRADIAAARQREA